MSEQTTGETTAEDTAEATAQPSVRVVLVPGFWLGAWAWDEVLAALEERGVDAVPVTLPGLEPDHGARGEVSLQDHADTIEQALSDDPAVPTVLVAHSGAAVPATVVLDRAPERVAHAIWVDTAPVVDGYAMNPGFEGDEYPLSAQWDEELEQGSMRDLTPEQLQTFQDRAVPEPAAALREAVSLTDPRRLAVPGTVVCTAFPAEDYRSYAEQGAPFLAALQEFTALELVDLPTGHWPMWSKPSELAELIAGVAGRAGR